MIGIARAWRIGEVSIMMAFLGMGVARAAEGNAEASKPPQQDTIKTEAGDLKITFIGHASLMFEYQGKFVYVDPVSREGDYSKMPKADLILITHEHPDHLDPKALALIRKDQTKILMTQSCADKVPDGTVIKNGQTMTVDGFKIEAVPAYNIVHKRPDGQPYHPKGVGNGYVINFDKTRVYVAGDTEDIPEMAQLKDIAVAFLPMNLPYTMTPEMVAHAAQMFQPRILYPYHYGQTDVNQLINLLKDSKIEVRIRKMK